VAVRVGGARIDVPSAIGAVSLALEGRRQVDRRRDRGGGRIDGMAGADGERLDAHGTSLGKGPPLTATRQDRERESRRVGVCVQFVAGIVSARLRHMKILVTGGT